MLGDYPPGITEADFRENPFDHFFENFEPTDEQLETYIEENPKALVDLFNQFPKSISLKDLQEFWKQNNLSIIEDHYESSI